MRSVAQGEAWAKSAAAEYRNGSSWAGWCLSFVFRFGAFENSADTAYLAYKGSGPVQSTDYSKAPAGAIHWWSDGGAGHVAVSLGKGVAAMASAGVTTRWGDDQGSVQMAHYNAQHPGLKYLGWTLDMMGGKMTDITESEAAAKKAKAEAAAKAAAEAAAKKAAEEAAAAKAKSEQEAEEKAVQAAADAASAKPVALPILVREKSDSKVYSIVDGSKYHLPHNVYQVYKIVGATVTELPDGALDGFKEVSG